MSQNLSNALPPRSATSSDSSGDRVEGSLTSGAPLELVAALPPAIMTGFELVGGSPMRLLEGLDPEEEIVVDAGTQTIVDQQLETSHATSLRSSEDLPQDLPPEDPPQDSPSEDLPQDSHHVFVDYAQAGPGAEIMQAATLPYIHKVTPYDPAGLEPPLRIDTTYDSDDDRKLPATTSRKTKSKPRIHESHKNNQLTASPIRVKKPRATKKFKAAKHKSKRNAESKGSSSSSGQSASERDSMSERERIYEPSQEELDAAANARAKTALKTWYSRLQELVEYKRQHGNTNVPQKYPPNEALGVWVNKQRMEKRALDEGKRSSMTPRKIELLQEIGFKWAKKKGRAAWDNKYSRMKQYKEAHGDCDVPTKYSIDRPLGRWVSTQRSVYKAFQNQEEQSLTNEEVQRRIRLLDALGFSWAKVPYNQEEEDSEREDEEEEEELWEPWEPKKET